MPSIILNNTHLFIPFLQIYAYYRIIYIFLYYTYSIRDQITVYKVCLSNNKRKNLSHLHKCRSVSNSPVTVRGALLAGVRVEHVTMVSTVHFAVDNWFCRIFFFFQNKAWMNRDQGWTPKKSLQYKIFFMIS